VRPEAVATVMHHFFREHPPVLSASLADHHSGSTSNNSFDVQCEEALLDAFQQRSVKASSAAVPVNRFVEVIGNSHLAGFKQACEESSILSNYFYPSNWFVDDQHYWRRDYSLPISTQDIHREYLSRLVFPEGSDGRRGIIFVGLGLMGDGVIRCIGSLMAGFTHKNGTIAAGKEISPSIPVVTSIEQIQQATILNFKENILFAKTMLDQIRKTTQLDTLHWICSPLPSERCARYRFGVDYVDSLAQKVYNQAYRQLMFDILGDEIRSGIILLQPESTIAVNGFTKDAFQAQEPVYGIHCSPELYKTYLDKFF
jgi:hypothetical protein